MKVEVVRILAALFYLFFSQPSMAQAPMMGPADVVKALVEIEHQQAPVTVKVANGKSIPTTSPDFFEQRDKNGRRLMSQSLNADLNTVLSKKGGDWYDADILTGHQDTTGMFLISIDQVTFQNESASTVDVTFHEHSLQDEIWGKPSKATFTLVRENGQWKVDEIETEAERKGIEDGESGLHAYFKHLQQGFWHCGKKECARPEFLIRVFDDADHDCRVSYELKEQGRACTLRDETAKTLAGHNYCYGKSGAATYEMGWHECASGSAISNRTVAESPEISATVSPPQKTAEAPQKPTFFQSLMGEKTSVQIQGRPSLDPPLFKETPTEDQKSGLPAQLATSAPTPEPVERALTSNDLEKANKKANALAAKTRKPLTTDQKSALAKQLAALAPTADFTLGAKSKAALSEFNVKDEFKECANCPTMMVIPPGSFFMGSPPNEKGRENVEGPLHEVSITEPLAIGKFPIMRDEFAAFVKETGYDAGSSCAIFKNVSEFVKTRGFSWKNPGFSQTGSHPATCLSWDDAKAYVEWLRKKTGEPYRLLTEAEYEYATRAVTRPVTNTSFSFGPSDTISCQFGNGLDQTARHKVPGIENWNAQLCSDGYAYTSPVGSFQPNGFGLYDMQGNVWEWAEDCFTDNYIGAPVDGSAKTSERCNQRVRRGGSWFNQAGELRAAIRHASPPELRASNIGFRVARGLAPGPMPMTAEAAEHTDTKTTNLLMKDQKSATTKPLNPSSSVASGAEFAGGLGPKNFEMLKAGFLAGTSKLYNYKSMYYLLGTCDPKNSTLRTGRSDDPNFEKIGADGLNCDGVQLGLLKNGRFLLSFQDEKDISKTFTFAGGNFDVISNPTMSIFSIDHIYRRQNHDGKSFDEYLSAMILGEQDGEGLCYLQGHNIETSNQLSCAVKVEAKGEKTLYRVTFNIVSENIISSEMMEKMERNADKTRASLGKILWSLHGGDATIDELIDANTDHARVWFSFKREDVINGCSLDAGLSPAEVKKCADEAIRAQTGRTFLRKGNCSTLTIYVNNDDTNIDKTPFTMVKYVKEAESKSEGGKVYRPIRTDWKNIHTGEIIGNSSAAMTPEILDTLKVLCPMRYDQMFRGFDPY